MNLKQAYLFLYNASLCLGWGYVLVLTYRAFFAGGSLSSIWENVEAPLILAQTAAIMEVIHAALGLVRSPVMITATQVASRIWILWGIIIAAPSSTTTRSLILLDIPGPLPTLSLNLVTLLTAWCLSEIIRYGFFAFKEAGLQPYFLLWLRYTAFIVLYPLGVSSELAMVALALPELRSSQKFNISMPNSWNFGFTYWIACIVGVVAYLPGFPQLYVYMLTQRRKVLRRGGSSSGRGTATVIAAKKVS